VFQNVFRLSQSDSEDRLRQPGHIFR